MIFRSQYPDVELPNLPITQVVLRHADRLADKPALIEASTGRAVTYGQLRHSIDRAAAGLAGQGVRQGDVVAIYAPNSIEYVIAFHAIVTLGATAATVHPLFLTEELKSQLILQKARYLIVTADLLDRAEEAFRDTALRKLVVIGEAAHHPTFASLMASKDPVPLVQIDVQNDVAALLCSSGTTGLPKSVMLTHKALVAMGLLTEAAAPIFEHDVMPACLPFFHAFGLLSVMTSGLSSGSTSVVMPRFDFAQFLQAIQDYRVTRTWAAPPMLVQLAKNAIVDDYDLSSLKVIICGAAPLGADIEQVVRNRIGCQVKQGYGMTEIVPALVGEDDIPSSKQGSVGMCVPNVRVKVVDTDTGLPLGTGQSGELWIKGPSAMKGYLDNPEATASTLDLDGWVHTGDVGYADEDGYFYIVDRLKELIKYKAYQVAPAELEAVLLTHPAIADAAVVRFPDEDAGEVPKAFVVLKSPATSDELMAYVADRVAPYKKVRRIEFIDAIPKSVSGKILRRVLVERDRAALPVMA